MKSLNIVLALVISGACFSAGQAYANPFSFTATLNQNENVPTGSALIVFDTSAHTMSVNVVFNGLLSITTASHIHCCTTTPLTGAVGVATEIPVFNGFPLGVSSGVYSHVFDMTLLSFYSAPFVVANGGTSASAELALLNGALAGKEYLNIHTRQFPGGEIRGFLVRQVPEASSLALLLLGVAGLSWRRYKSM